MMSSSELRELIDKLKVMEAEIAADRGPFTLFAVLLRDGSPDRWDVVVAAPWLENRREYYDFFAGELVGRLTLEEMITISKIVIVEAHYPFLHEVLQAHRVEHGCIEVRDVRFDQIEVEKGYIITAQPVSQAGAAKSTADD